ncbi:hypothetical protein LMG24235_07597 [Paraburkholderia sabiae]|nr:hypothetical protein LMG24235_07597 [Paraburkholderia sabiae]
MQQISQQAVPAVSGSGSTQFWQWQYAVLKLQFLQS